MGPFVPYVPPHLEQQSLPSLLLLFTPSNLSFCFSPSLTSPPFPSSLISLFPTPKNPAGVLHNREAIYKADVYCKVSHELGASPNVIVIGGCV